MVDANKIPWWHEQGSGRFNPNNVRRYYINCPSVSGSFVNETDFDALFEKYVSAVNLAGALTIEVQQLNAEPMKKKVVKEKK